MAAAPAVLLFFSVHTLAVVLLTFAASGAGQVALFSHIRSTLARGESLYNNGSTLTLQGDCDLVLRNAKNMIVWNSGSVDPGVDCIFWVGQYGVAIVSDVEGSPLWSTGSPGPLGNYAVLLRPDGSLRTYGPSTWTLEQQSKSAEIITAPAEPRQGEASARPPAFDASGYVLYSSEDFIYEPAAGVMLRNGNYSLVLETSCTIHIRRNNYDQAEKRPRRRQAARAKAPPCKTEMTPYGQLTAYKMLFAGESGLDDVWVRTWGSNYTVMTRESIAALVDRGTTGELVVYPARKTIA